MQAEVDDVVGTAVVQPRMQLARLARQLQAVLVAEDLQRIEDEVQQLCSERGMSSRSTRSSATRRGVMTSL